MPKLSLSKVAGLLPTLVLAILAVGCTDETIVYQERAPFNPPADAASGFVGYYTVSQKQTTCGNCHADFQAEWSETRHASAYKSLTDLPAGTTQPYCFSCHAVTNRGNNSAGKAAGYDVVADSTYRDVQCESCHGGGLQHIESVNAGSVIRPLAHLGLGVKDQDGVIQATADTAASCAACHTGVHTPFVEQWLQSRHALVRKDEVTRVGATCQGCHEGRGAAERLTGDVTWVEGKWSATDPIDKMLPITCGVCHDPHGGPNKYQLRFPINSLDENNNLCIKCHNNRAQPVGGSSRGNQPHGAQGGVLLGFAGYRPPNFGYDTARIFGSHATSANPDLCAGCHVQRQTINDASGKFQFQSVGHLFKPIPCLDAKGNPTGDDDCDDTATARSWIACTKSGCHANATAAANLFNATATEVQGLVDFLWNDKNANRALDAYPTDDGYLALIKKNTTDINPSDQIITAADGCQFNVYMTAPHLADHPDGSKGTHNPFLYRALLTSCASYLKSIYAFLPAPPASLQAIIDKWDAPVQGNKPVIARVPLPAFDR